MKLKLKVAGPLEGPLKNLFLAQGQNETGEECSLLVRQSGNNAILCLHSSVPSVIGKQKVVSYKGNTVAQGTVEPGASFEYAVEPFLKEHGAKKETTEELLARQGAELKEVKALLSDAISLIEKQSLIEKPAAPADEAPNTPASETEKPE